MILAACIAVYVIGFLVAGFFIGRETWRNGDDLSRHKPHDVGYTWGTAIGFGAVWPITAIALLLYVICVGISWPFKTENARRFTERLWG